MAKTGSPASGFTLLELLVVITILGMIVLALNGGVRFAGQAWLMQERRSAESGDLDSVQAVIRNLITSGRSFEGNGASLRFISPLPEALARGGLYEVDLHTAGDRLVLDWKPSFKGPASFGSMEAELARNISGLTFSYFIPPDGWQTTIPDKTKPPGLIRVTIRMKGSRPLPVFFAAPMVDIDPAAMK